MRYVQRDPKTGEVTGHFANEQPYATESVADDHPDILAFYARRKRLWNPPAREHIPGTFRRSPYARGMARLLAAHFGMSVEGLLALVADAAESEDVVLPIAPLKELEARIAQLEAKLAALAG